MRVEVIYTNKSKHIKPVAEAMARWVKTYAKSINDFDKNATIDLLLIGFDDSVRKDSELENFIKNLDRKNVHNIALFNAFYLNDHKMTNMIKLCQETNLPLMREQYSFKLTFKQLKEIDQCVIDGARLYIEDMVNIVRDYY
ncbi:MULTISPECIES: hypothetical protein [unclassified Thomasclavelia]|uniref:Uncharacterized protein n=1 Tax=Candidatus Erysipelatoclostridium merdavium TaxID=2838566 RepID=A0A9D2BKZ4_9FIRM|nr:MULTISPECIES: hypothetical protein [unclassified Thomasclavelia]OUP76983.1 hypothetical protein B5F09_07290 [Erysipelatoclostridium sp. An173]HIX80560.1 hypothetical protein [Candidatus Erysipelatoclostridium merdavium]